MTPIEQTFKFCPKCGTGNANTNKDKPGANPFRCSRCEFIFYFSPIAAVGGIVTDGSKVLFLVRGKDPGKGKLGIPGGFVDAGETLEDSLAREVFEEASLKVTRTQYLCSFPNQYLYRGIQVEVTDAFFVCEVESLDSLSAQESEVEEFRWIESDSLKLEDLAFESNRLALQYFLQHRTVT